ncbi:MAG TPA: single-stranded DNA-binding protein, partial [bacterium]|nr:single-stranded DNA-binding protein [bacterium]
DGAAVATFSLAINRFYKNKSTGELKQQVDFIPIVTWGKQAETCSEFLAKGRSALVEGLLVSRSWETPAGEKRSRIEVLAQRVQFLTPAGGRSQNAGAGAEAEKTEPEHIIEEPPSEGGDGNDVPF